VAWAAGFDAVAKEFEHVSWPWLVIAPAGLLISYPGYVLAFREVARVEADSEVALGAAAALVASGFGLFALRGGFEHDRDALEHSGIGRREARLRVLGVGALEYAVLAPATCGAALYILVSGGTVPRSFTLPWAVCVPLGFVLAAVAYRFRAKLTGDHGWRGVARDGFDALDCLLALGRKPALAAGAAAGMTLYWVGDVFVLWAALRAFVPDPGVPAVIVAYATGYALTRRSLPLGGAGVVAALLAFSLHWIGFAFAAAVPAVLVYRAYNLWLVLPPAFAGTSRLRRRLSRARLQLGTARS
jgi:uncharacterized membrane protein YbhN (UPF0104 family)